MLLLCEIFESSVHEEHSLLGFALSARQLQGRVTLVKEVVEEHILVHTSRHTITLLSRDCLGLEIKETTFLAIENDRVVEMVHLFREVSSLFSDTLDSWVLRLVLEIIIRKGENWRGH